MKIIVCIKQVPARDSQLRVASSGAWIQDADLSYEINEPDAYALEEGLQLKEKHGGEVVVLCAGPARAAQTIREGLAKGADRAIHIGEENLGAFDDPAKRAQPYDFRRPDRIAKDQLRAIHILHENFARSLASSLSAYLRAYVVVNLVSVEQLSFMEFSQCLPSPSCLVSLGMKPYEGNAVLEINPGLVFPIIEMLLGGGARSVLKVSREITEIEQSV